MDEADISLERRWFHELHARTVVKNLQKRNMNAQYFPNRQEALPAVLEMIPPVTVVARGDSVSFDQIGVIPELQKRNQNRIIDPFERDADGRFATGAEERLQRMREVFFADVFLTGTNAITLDGRLVNTDGRGNRVAAMIFGPSKVIVVAGVNKIVRDVDEALERIRRFAAPVNAKRHFMRHHRPEFGELPCVRTGACADCRHPWRICNYTTIIDGAMARETGRINVVLIGEELGI